MGRFERSIYLVGQSYRILMDDQELVLLPVMSGIITALVAVSFFFGFGLDAAFSAGGVHLEPVFYLPIFLGYVAIYFVGIFFQAAVIAGASEKLRGAEPTLGTALEAAASRVGSILLWAIIAATVGTLLRALRDRANLLGRIVAGIIGAAWSFATFFVVPVLVLEDVPPTEALSRSVSLLRRTWGEAVVGSSGLSLVLALLLVALALVVCVILTLHAYAVAVIVGASGWLFLLAVFSTLQGIYVAALYQYASTGQAPAGFDATVLAQAFRPR